MTEAGAIDYYCSLLALHSPIVLCNLMHLVLPPDGFSNCWFVCIGGRCVWIILFKWVIRPHMRIIFILQKDTRWSPYIVLVFGSPHFEIYITLETAARVVDALFARGRERVFCVRLMHPITFSAAVHFAMHNSACIIHSPLWGACCIKRHNAKALAHFEATLYFNVANLLAIITKVKFVTAVKFHYRVLQLPAVFLTPLGVTFFLLAMVPLKSFLQSVREPHHKLIFPVSMDAI